MLRLPGKGRSTSRPLGRRRISNQLAAFAAIMLFASTQVPSSNSADSVVTAAQPEVQQAALELEEGKSDALEQDVDTSALRVSTPTSGQKKSRGLNFSLFLLRR